MRYMHFVLFVVLLLVACLSFQFPIDWGHDFSQQNDDVIVNMLGGTARPQKPQYGYEVT